MRAARGEYIGFLDCDDSSYPERLLELVRGLDAHSEWIAAFHDLEMIDNDGQSLSVSYLGWIGFLKRLSELLIDIGDGWFECKPNYREYLGMHPVGIHTQSVLIARNRLRGLDISFDTQYRIVDDLDLWLRLARAGRIGYLNEVLGCYRQHEASITKRKGELAKEYTRVYAKNYNEVKDTWDQKKLSEYRDFINRACANLAGERYVAGSHTEARDLYNEAIRWNPDRRYRIKRLKTYLPPRVSRVLRRIRASWK